MDKTVPKHNSKMRLLHIKETCIYVHDLDRTESFYHGKLELEIIAKVEGRHIFFRVGNSVLLCFIASATENNTHTPGHGASGSIHFAMEVLKEDYIETKKELISKGIIIEQEHEWQKGLLSFYFYDPDGHLLEIAQKGIWEKE